MRGDAVVRADFGTQRLHFLDVFNKVIFHKCIFWHYGTKKSPAKARFKSMTAFAGGAMARVETVARQINALTKQTGQTSNETLTRGNR
jgi:hypothetical protein